MRVPVTPVFKQVLKKVLGSEYDVNPNVQCGIMVSFGKMAVEVRNLQISKRGNPQGSAGDRYYYYHTERNPVIGWKVARVGLAVAFFRAVLFVELHKAFFDCVYHGETQSSSEDSQPEFIRSLSVAKDGRFSPSPRLTPKASISPRREEWYVTKKGRLVLVWLFRAVIHPLLSLVSLQLSNLSFLVDSDGQKVSMVNIESFHTSPNMHFLGKELKKHFSTSKQAIFVGADRSEWSKEVQKSLEMDPPAGLVTRVLLVGVQLARVLLLVAFLACIVVVCRPSAFGLGEELTEFLVDVKMSVIAVYQTGMFGVVWLMILAMLLLWVLFNAVEAPMRLLTDHPSGNCECHLRLLYSPEEGLKASLHFPRWAVSVGTQSLDNSFVFQDFLFSLGFNKLAGEIKSLVQIRAQSVDYQVENREKSGDPGGRKTVNISLGEARLFGSLRLVRDERITMEVNCVLQSVVCSSTMTRSKLDALRECIIENKQVIDVTTSTETLDFAMSFEIGILYLGTDVLVALSSLSASSKPIGDEEYEESSDDESDEPDDSDREEPSNSMRAIPWQINIANSKICIGNESQSLGGMNTCFWISFSFRLQYARKGLQQLLQIENGSISLGSVEMKGELDKYAIMLDAPFSLDVIYNSSSKNLEGGLQLGGVTALLSCSELISLHEMIQECSNRPPVEDYDYFESRGEDEEGIYETQIDNSYITASKSRSVLFSEYVECFYMIRCSLGAQQVYLGVDLHNCKVCVRALPPSLFKSDWNCSILKADQVRGSKFFRLALTAPGWENFFLAKSETSQHKLTLKSLPLDHSDEYAEWYTKHDKSGTHLCCRHENSSLNLTEYGIFCLDEERGTPIELVHVNISHIPKLQDFRVHAPHFEIRLLTHKTPMDTINNLSASQSGGPEEIDLVRVTLCIDKFYLSSNPTITCADCEIDVSIWINDLTESNPAVPFLTATRLNFVYFCTESEKDLLVFAWDTITFNVSEASIEILCIIFQKLGSMQHFKVKHAAFIQDLVLVGAQPVLHTKRLAPQAMKKRSRQKGVSSFQGIVHVSNLSVKVMSLLEPPTCELLVCRLKWLSLKYSAFGSGNADSSHLILNIERMDADTSHPNTSSFVCMRTKIPTGTTFFGRSNAESDPQEFLDLDVSVETIDFESNVSAYLWISPLELNVYEDVILKMLGILMPYQKALKKGIFKGEGEAKRRENAARKIQNWFRDMRSSDTTEKKLHRVRTRAAKKIQRHFRKKIDKRLTVNTEVKRPTNVPEQHKYHIVVLDIHPLHIATEYHSSRTTMYSHQSEDTLTSEIGTILEALGAPTVGMVNVHCRRILLRDVDMSFQDIIRAFTQNLLKYSLLAVAQESVEHNIPWLDGAMNQYFALESMHASRQRDKDIEESSSKDEKEKDKGRRGKLSRALTFIVYKVPKRFIFDPCKFAVQSGTVLVKQAGWSFLIASASDMTDCAVKGAETSGIMGVYNGVVVSGARMLTTPPKQHVFRLWASRNALSSGLSVTFHLSDSVGMNDTYLEAYLQGVVDHLFQCKSCEVIIKNSDQLSIENLPILERDRDEVVEYLENILHAEDLIEEEHDHSQRAQGGASGSAFSARLRHLSHKDKSPKKQLLNIARSFMQNIAIVLAAQQLKGVLPFHRLFRTLMGRCRSKRRLIVVRTVVSSGLMFGYRKCSWIIPTSFAKKVVHTYLLSIIFNQSIEQGPVSLETVSD